METKQANGVLVLNGTAKENNKPAQNGAAKGIHAQTAKEHSIAKTEAEKPKPETPKSDEPKKEEPKPATDQPKENVPVAKPVLNLEGTLKVVETLHRKGIQRLNLIARMNQLETFEVNLATENDELEDNLYQGCKLIIEDDKQRRFVTTTPGLIRLVSQFIFNACHEKLAEIEANIVFPKA